MSSYLGIGEVVVVDSITLDENYSPEPYNPAIDAAIGDCPATDFYGVPRPIGDQCDIGAVESVYTAMIPPSNVTGTLSNYIDINLTWQDNATYETGYRVERSTDGVNWTEIVTLPADSEAYGDAGLACFSSYSYRVSSKVGQFSETSDVIIVETNCPPLVAPSGL